MKLLIASLLSIFFCFPVVSQEKAVKKAQKFIDKGKTEKALKIIEGAVDHEDTKTNGEAWLVYGQIYLDMAESDSENAKKAQKGFTKAEEFGLNEELAKSCKEYKGALAMRAYLSATESYEAKSYSDAIPYFEVFRDLNPKDSSGYYNVAVTSFYAKDFERAVENYESLFDLGLNSSMLYQYIIDASTRVENPGPKTATWISEAKRIYPNETNLWEKLEFNYKIRSQEGDELIATLYDWFDGDTTNAELNFDLGTVYYGLNDTTKAVYYFKKSMALDPNYASPAYNLGTMYYNLASERYKEANNLPLGDERYNEIQDEGLEFMKKARPYLERTVEIDPNDANAWNGLAKIYGKLGMYEEMKAARSKYKAITGN